jgi:hypothetical protein
MEAFRAFSMEAIGKFGRGEALTELEQIVVYETLKVDELNHVARWARAREEFRAMRTAALLPPITPLTGGWTSCWEVDSSREYMCINMGEGGITCLVMDVFTRTSSMRHSTDFTTRSPYGDFLLLKDARVGEVVFTDDDLLDGWTSIRIERIEPDGSVYARTSLETSYVADAVVTARKMVSRTPPEWGGQCWSLNPFTHEVCLYEDVTSTEPMLRTHNPEVAKGFVRRHRDHMPGLWSAFTFLQNNPTYFPKVPGVEYASWTPQGAWAPALCHTDARTISTKSVPRPYAHGYVTVPALCSGGRSVHPTGWYMGPNGVTLFTDGELVRVLPYKDTIEYIEPTAIELRLDHVAFQFDTEEARVAFLEAFCQNAKAYKSFDVFVSHVRRGGV